MLNTTTVTKLREMKLSMMAEAFQSQLKDSAFHGMSFEERFGLIVDQEWSARKSNRLKDLIKKAGFDEPGACIENIDYYPDRKLDREKIIGLSTCNYIREHQNILLLGATGCGKTYIACALGIAAARNFFRVKYVRLQDLLTDLKIARAGNTFPKAVLQYKKPALLIIDEWMRYPLSEMESRDVLEIADSFSEAVLGKGKFTACLRILWNHIGVTESDDNHNQRAKDHGYRCACHTGVGQELLAWVNETAPADHAAEGNRPNVHGIELTLKRTAIIVLRFVTHFRFTHLPASIVSHIISLINGLQFFECIDLYDILVKAGANFYMIVFLSID